MTQGEQEKMEERRREMQWQGRRDERDALEKDYSELVTSVIWVGKFPSTYQSEVMDEVFGVGERKGIGLRLPRAIQGEAVFIRSGTTLQHSPAHGP